MNVVRVYTAVAGADYQPRTDVQCFKGEDIFTRGVLNAKRYKIS